MFLLLAANGIESDAALDELHELDQADDDLSDGAKWAQRSDYWERIRETVLRHSSAKDVKLAIQEWTSDGHVFVQHGGTCELCGKIPISWRFPIKNRVTGSKLIVGNECVRNYRQLAGKVDLDHLQKMIRKQKDLLRKGKGTQEDLTNIEGMYRVEKALRAKLAGVIGSGDLDVTEFRNEIQAAEKVGQILRVQSDGYKLGRGLVAACRSYLAFQDRLGKAQKYKPTGIGDTISAIMRQKKGDFGGQLDQLKQVESHMKELFAAGSPNEVVSRMWAAISDAREALVAQILARGDETKAQMLKMYSDELEFTKSYPHLYFVLTAGLNEHRAGINKKIAATTQVLRSESFFDDVAASRALPTEVGQRFYADFAYGEGVTVKAASNLVQFIDLLRKGFLKNVIDVVQERYKLKTIKDIAGVKKAILRAADDSIIDADVDGANAVGKFVVLIRQGESRTLALVQAEVDDIKEISEKKVYEQMSLDLGIDVERVFKLYISDNDFERGFISTIFKSTWPSGKKLSTAQIGNIERQLAKYARIKERPHSMWQAMKHELTAAYRRPT